MNNPAEARPVPVRPPESPPPGIKLGDIYYILFRHKWKIVLSALLGVCAAAGIWVFHGGSYQSEAKLLVRYVRDSKAFDASLGAQGDVKSPDARGENIINSELEIITSRDLAVEVADLVGPERILARLGGGTNRFAAAGAILRGIELDVPRRSSVIRVVFNHPDPEIAQPVLRQLVKSYLQKHAEVHRAVGVFDDFLTRQTDSMRSRLTQTEQELQKLKLGANVASVEESKRLIGEQVAKIRQELMTAEAQLAERRTILGQLQPSTAATSTTVSNAEPAVVEQPLDPDKERHYRAVLTQLEGLRTREWEARLQFTPESREVRQIQDLIASADQSKKQLEMAEPRLLRLAFQPATPSASGPGRFESADLAAQETEVLAIESRIKVLKDYQERARAELAAINDVEQRIRDLERRRQQEERAFLLYSSSLEQARVDESLGASSLANINVLQDATPASMNQDKTRKAAMAALGIGLAGGLSLAFLLEFGLNSRIKRSVDIEQKLRLPLFLLIPDIARNGHAKAQREQRRLKTTPRKALADASTAPSPSGNGEATADPSSSKLPAPLEDPLRTYYEALRDRLIMYFEFKELHHKPKLVGVTGTHHGAGVSRVAAGLAESLSETGDGNVLLVDMNPQHGPSVYPFHKGKAGCGLTEALEQEQREPAQVQDNLYVVSLNDTQGNRVGIVPKKFASLMPKMKASDYDYIIFDMPPVSQTSVTSKVAGLLDMTFLVVESERTNTEQAKRCAALLAESRANVAAVMNRHHDYLPERLRTDI
ncbi:MAG: Wzz/FepE/Etk N-terminal domain-containing protein [Verrucomicrobia bacterium]|nr:Wzz/FepE/Etk N-terminal domain-containing protein [Verrucomicrobiota bacterium]